MSKLNDAQLVLLSKASQREDRALEVAPPRKAAVTKALDVLIKRNLVTDVASERAMPVWRHTDDTNEPRSLIISDLGLIAIGVLTEREAGAEMDETVEVAVPSQPVPTTVPSGKTATVVKLLQRKEGASIAALIEATGWLPHSTRAALTGLRKKGFDIERGKAKDKITTIYRIAKAPAAGKAA